MALTKTLICTGIKSAVKTLQILSNSDSLLGKLTVRPLSLKGSELINGCLEVFLPYDLEFAYAAAIHLAMANALFPQEVDGPAHIQEAHSIIDGLVYNGNKVAEVRKAELVHLQSLFEELAARVHSQGLQPLTLCTPHDMAARSGNNTSDGDSQNRVDQPDGEPAFDPGFMSLSMLGYSESSHSADMQMPGVEFLDNIGISSAEFLSIVEQIGNPDFSSVVLDFEPNGEDT